MTTVVRLAVFTGVAAIAIVCAVAAASARHGATQISFAGDPPGEVLTGFYGAERAPDGLTYAWTRPAFGLALDGLSRAVPTAVVIRYRAARPEGSSPEVTITVDGVVTRRERLEADFVERRIELPARAGNTPSHVTFTIAPAYVPAGDPRQLGALVDWIEVDRGDVSLWPSDRMWLAMLPVLALAVFWALVAVPARVAGPLLGLCAAVGAWIVTLGVGPFVHWPTLAIAGVAISSGAVTWVITRRVPCSPTIAAITSAAVCLKLLLLTHPAMPIGDAMFHAHRLQTVLAGNYYFTSITPGDYQFPYAPGLYVLSGLFSWMTDTTADKVVLLRMVTTAVEAIAASWLAVWLWQWRGHAGMAVCAVTAYHLLPLSVNVLAVGNLTNLFAQALAMVAIAVAAHGRWSAARVVVVLLLTLAASLSHTSTFVILTTHLAAASLWLSLNPTTDRRAGWWLGGTVTVAALLAVGLYYGHFIDVYQMAMTRVGDETGRAAASAGFRTPMTRLLDVPRLLELYYAVPGLLLGGFGLIELWRARTASHAAWVIAASGTFVLAGFLVLGIVTPLDFRHYLAALPLVAMGIGCGAVALWQTGLFGRVAAGVAGAWLTLVGLQRAATFLG